LNSLHALPGVGVKMPLCSGVSLTDYVWVPWPKCCMVEHCGPGSGRSQEESGVKTIFLGTSFLLYSKARAVWLLSGTTFRALRT